MSIEEERTIAETKALDSLARYKFVMFGYWAGVWTHLNKLCEKRQPNPFRLLVVEAQCILHGIKGGR